MISQRTYGNNRTDTLEQHDRAVMKMSVFVPRHQHYKSRTYGNNRTDTLEHHDRAVIKMSVFVPRHQNDKSKNIWQQQNQHFRTA